MRLVKTLAIVLVISVGIAGCASRRCCNCACHLRTQEMANNENAAELNQGLVSAAKSAPQDEDIPAMIAEAAPERPPFETPAVEADPRFDLAKTKILPKRFPKNEVNVASNDTIYGHADDYSWLKGRLQKVHVPGVEWKIRYLPIDQADQWGGSVVLAPDIRLEDFKDRDVVYIQGKQLENRPSLYITGPLYRIETIRPQEPVGQTFE